MTNLRTALQTDPRTAGLHRVVFASRMDHMGWREKLKFALLHNVQDGHWLPWFAQRQTKQQAASPLRQVQTGVGARTKFPA